MSTSGRGSPSIAGELARMYSRTQGTATEAGRILHDEVGPLLSAVGLRMQLLRLDHTAAGEEVDQITTILDEAYERIRAVSQALAPSPVLRGGLKNAFERLAETLAAEGAGLTVSLRYDLKATVPVEIGCALYEAAVAAVSAARGASARRIAIIVNGRRGAQVRISDDGRPASRRKRLASAEQVAEACGLLMTVTTKQSTIVSIRYAL